MTDSFPADPANHFEGILLKTWRKRSVAGSELKSDEDICKSVCKFYKHQAIKHLTITIDI
jgi:hypothetical protein